MKGCDKMKRMLLFVFLMLFFTSLVYVSAVQYVNFNGDFGNGSTLYSNTYFIQNFSIYGKDVYPVKNCSLQNVTSTRKKSTFVTEYLNRTKTTCRLINHTKNCTSTDYQIPRKVRTFILVPYQRTISVCDPIPLPIGCENPGFTNQLSLGNFAMSFDSGATWQNIPYQPNQTLIINSTLLFKLDIPSVCSPVYDINKSIVIG